MENPKIILAGLPGDMTTRVLHSLKKNGYELPSLDKRVRGKYLAFTGGIHRGKNIEKDFLENYLSKNDIMLIMPKNQKLELEWLKDKYKDNLIGINFATAEGYDTNFKFADQGIPFISGVTGMPKKQESDLVKKIQEENKTCAIIDKNMSSGLTVFGAMLKYAAENFPGALEGYSGFAIDDHQSTKKDDKSGSVLTWGEALENLGVDLEIPNGIRRTKHGHADHIIRITNSGGTVKIGFETQVFGRDDYANGTVEKGLPFLIEAMNHGKQGKVYKMKDALQKNF